MVSAPVSGPSACCLPGLSLSPASASVGRVWQAQRVFAQQAMVLLYNNFKDIVCIKTLLLILWTVSANTIVIGLVTTFAVF